MGQFTRGFTLIELLVVIAIIGLMSSVVLASLGEVRKDARNTRRHAHMRQIVTALHLYEADHGHFVEEGSGCGWAGNGSGFLSADNEFLEYYAEKSIADCLIDGGYLGEGIITGDIAEVSSLAEGFIYMKYTCDKGTFLYTYLEGKPTGEVIPNDICQDDNIDIDYGMNYYVQVN